MEEEWPLFIRMILNVSSTLSHPHFPPLKQMYLRWVAPTQCCVPSSTDRLNTIQDFVNDFSDLLAESLPKYDRVLLFGDFNIHVCCPDKPLVKDFLRLIDSFNLE